MCSQDANPVKGPFCSLVRPWTVSKLAPAFSNMQAYSTVRLISGNTRNLHVTGTRSPCFKVDTVQKINLLYHFFIALGNQNEMLAMR